MRQTWLVLDRILRGDSTQPDRLLGGRLPLPIPSLSTLLIGLAAFYGICMGTFALLRPDGPEWRQMLAAGVKLPLLFFLTLAITFPSLYVFSAILSAPLTVLTLASLLIAALSVSLAVLASLGPIEAFFALSTTSYDFMILLNVAICGVAGLLGVRFLLQTLHHLSLSHALGLPGGESSSAVAEANPEAADTDSPPLGALDATEHQISPGTRLILRVWVLIYALVGVQMAWILRPFIGAPNQPFTWFRERHSNFFAAVWHCLTNLLS